MVRVLYDFSPNGETEATTPKHHMSEMERWVRENIGWRASSYARLRAYDYFDWAINTYWELDKKVSKYEPIAELYFRDPDAAILFKLRWAGLIDNHFG